MRGIAWIWKWSDEIQGDRLRTTTETIGKHGQSWPSELISELISKLTSISAELQATADSQTPAPRCLELLELLELCPGRCSHCHSHSSWHLTGPGPIRAQWIIWDRFGEQCMIHGIISCMILYGSMHDYIIIYIIYNQKVCLECFGSGDEGGAISLQSRNLRSHSPSCRILPSSVG